MNSLETIQLMNERAQKDYVSKRTSELRRVAIAHPRIAAEVEIEIERLQATLKEDSINANK